MSGGRDDCDEVEQQLRLVSLALDAAGDSIIIHRLDGTLVRFNERRRAGGPDRRPVRATRRHGAGHSRWSDEARQKRLASLREQGEVTFVPR